ncbi:MAG: adenylate/guanylate cyclase domain-containing protein [Actinobacteria bacterium]|nr:MAG: adenylate/guanylate cyclase domain-containing protein [Actinomycetota bacterium]
MQPDAAPVRREDRARLIADLRARQIRNGLLANAIGALLVFAFLAWLIPVSPDFRREQAGLTVRSAIVLAFYLPFAMYVGVRWVNRYAEPVQRWLLENRPPDEDERRRALALPLAPAKATAALWGVGAILFTAVNAPTGAATLANTAAITLGGLTTAALTYLLAERTQRPVTALALADAPPERPSGPGVRPRLIMAWALGTGVPLLGILAVAVDALLDSGVDRQDLAWAVIFLTATAAAAGLALTLTAARSLGDPLTAVRGALARVERGDLDAQVPVDDGSEIGLVEAGFNTMVAGLRDRERLREAFGTYVDPELTERVLREGTDLAGEEVEVSVLFMDVRDFTTYAESASAQDVVATLNDLYGDVVPIIAAHGGHANKFIGDGLLAVFGAPRRMENHAACAVAAALEIARIVSQRHGDKLRVGIGVNSGRVVAGTIGGGGRLEFTVIGDVVNTAARVEAATRQTGDDVLITEATLVLLGGEPGAWEERPAITLKGKTRPVRLYAPARTAAGVPA